MNNFEKLKSMSVEELAKLLDKYGRLDNTPWWDWWNDNFCDKCEGVTAYVPDWDRECKFAWCELEHKCRFFQDKAEVPDGAEVVKMWLESEVKV